MIHLKYRVHGQDLRIGISPLLEVAPSIEKVVVIERAGISVFKNLAAPGFVLATDSKLSPDSIDNLKKSWGDKFSGRNQGKTPVLDSGLKPIILDTGKATDFQIAELILY